MSGPSDDERVAIARAEARAFLTSDAAMAEVEARDPELFARMLLAASEVLHQEAREHEVAAGSWMRSPLDLWIAPVLADEEVHFVPYLRSGDDPLTGIDPSYLDGPAE